MCLPIQRVAVCKAGDESIITLNQPSGGLASVFGYEAGERYYFACKYVWGLLENNLN